MQYGAGPNDLGQGKRQLEQPEKLMFQEMELLKGYCENNPRQKVAQALELQVHLLLGEGVACCLFTKSFCPRTSKLQSNGHSSSEGGPSTVGAFREGVRPGELH